MALNPSGQISLGGNTAGESINLENSQPATATVSLNDAAVRSLAGVPSGVIVMPTNFWGKSNSVAAGCATYGTAGTYTFTVPSGVSKISVVCVGGGQSGLACCSGCSGTGGGGGGLSYTNCIPVTSGESLTVVVGAGGLGVASCAVTVLPGQNPGAPSKISRGATKLIEAIGGQSFAPATANIAAGTGAVRYNGGNIVVTIATSGGGGAAGYAGCGGRGGQYSPPSTVSGVAGVGGAGGGGGGSLIPIGSTGGGAGGGGVGLIVQGANGSGGTGAPGPSAKTGGGGGSGGSNGSPLAGSTATNGGPGGNYGGAGGANGDAASALPSYAGGNGGSGGVRIIYGGTGRSYPNAST
jgi:hypothetical protein